MTEKSTWQKIEAKGTEVLDRIRELVAEGNVRRIRVRQRDRTIAEFPLTVGVVGAVLAPVLAAIGALTALLTDCTIDVERAQPEPAGVSDHARPDEQC
jgi:hypothetical protein